MTKLKKAPHFDKQAGQVNAFNDWIVLVGEKAHYAYYGGEKGKEAGKAVEWEFIRDAYRYPLDRHPVILDSKSFDEIDRLRLAPKDQTSIKFFQVGNVPTLAKDKNDLKTRIMMNLAANNAKAVAVEWLGAALEGENLYDEIQRIKAGNHAIAEIVAENAQKAILSDVSNEVDKHSPFIEKRNLGGIKGLYRIIPKYSAELKEWIESEAQWLSDFVEVVGIGRSGNESFLVLQWQPEGTSQKVIEALPMSDLGEREGWRRLKERGLNVTNKTGLRNELVDYLQNHRKGDRQLWTITHTTGWQNGAYILPSGEVIGEPETPVLFRSQSASAAGYDTAGTLESWQSEIARYVADNPSMMLGVATALSAPLISLLNAESFGVHLFEDSSRGKTTVAKIANSLYGHPEGIMLTWNATALGIINEAAARNDGFLAIDEIGQGTAKHAEQIAYTLFNGVGKIQGAKDGGNRELNRWQIVALSSGEKDLETLLSEKGIKVNAGQLIRLLNIPFEASKHYHGFATSKAHADHLNAATLSHYGVVGREWIRLLLNKRADVAGYFATIKAKWLARPPADADPQVFRVATRFAILETALQLAQPLTGWSEQQNAEAILHCFNQWINVFGFHSKKERQVIEQVNGWLLRYGSRFIEFPLNPNQREPNDSAGYKLLVSEHNDKERYLVYPQVYLDDVIKGHSERQANEILFKAGMLERSNESPPRFRVKAPKNISKNRTRCYVLIPLDESEDEEKAPHTAEAE